MMQSFLQPVANEDVAPLCQVQITRVEGFVLEGAESISLELRETINELNRVVDLKNEAERDLKTERCKVGSLNSKVKKLVDERTKAKEVEDELQRKILEIYALNTNQGFSEYGKSTIALATENFRHKIGQGGYGSVYRGQFSKAVAVKMLNVQSTQGQVQFHQEVSVLCKVRHPNIVTLIGACQETCALIYEFLPNGSLEDYLRYKNTTRPLTCKQRIKIISEVYSALMCLHSTMPHPIVHGDLKPDNVLLDSNFVSKLADFGLSRFLLNFSPSGGNYHQTKNPKGTRHYIDPVFLKTKQLKTYSDVYSFGVLILVMITGRAPRSIGIYVESRIHSQEFSTVLDSDAGSWPLAHMWKLVNYAIRCCNMNPENRPALNASDLGEIQAMLA